MFENILKSIYLIFYDDCFVPRLDPTEVFIAFKKPVKLTAIWLLKRHQMRYCRCRRQCCVKQKTDDNGVCFFVFFHFDTVIVMSSPAALMFVILMPEDELSFHLLDGVLLLLNVLLFPE